MSARRRNRDDVGMTLFPFMAVLICTMGALIMLLVVMVQQARVRARETSTVDVSVVEAAKQAANEALALQEQRRQEIEAAIAKQEQARSEYKAKQEQAIAAQQKIDELQWLADELRPSYDAVLEDLVQQRLALSHIEQHTRELSEQASKMQAEADLIAKTAEQGGSDVNTARTELDRLTSDLEVARDELKREREKFKEQVTKYALIPYDGPSGTQRPPIYIECLPDRVVLQPENVVLIGEDFRSPLSNQNPLAVALRAKREFMFKNGMLPNGLEPYPLLVVRPGGATSHAAARSAMKAWESEFGYELVESDLELDYQATDPRLKTILDDVVVEARGRRQMMFALMNSQRRGRQREVLRPSAGGGFETVSNGTRSLVGGAGSSSGNRLRNGGFGGNPNAPGPRPFESPGVNVGRANANSAGNGYGGSGTLAQQSSNGNRFSSSGDSAGNGFEGSAASTNGNSTSSPNGSDGNFGSNTQSVLGFRQPNQQSPQTSRYEGSVSSQRSQGFALNNNPGGSAGATGGRQQGAGSAAANRSMVAGQAASGQGATGQGASGTGGPSMQAGAAAGATAGSDFAQYQSLAHSRGGGWATRNTGDAAHALERSIRIVCESGRLVMVPEKNSREELQIFKHDGSLPAVIDPFVDAVQRRIASWGFSGNGMFWRPKLKVKVKSDAEHRYRQLLQLLDQSGIEVTREP